MLLLSSVLIKSFSEPALANFLVQNAESSETGNAGYNGFYRNLQEGKQKYNSRTKALDTGSSAAEIMEAKQNYLKDSQNNSQMAQRSTKETIGDNSNGIQKAADTIRKKLNLDEPVPQSTKDFLNDVQQKVDDIVAPIAGQ
ncbi:hypothetical protein AB3R30_10620 [Leptolyngbyaceae cyanobacterium UHCC 1019]